MNACALTRKQRELLDYLRAYQEAKGYSPSFHEMRAALSLKSKSGVHRLIMALEERGFIARIPYHARCIELRPEPHLPVSEAIGDLPTRDLIREAHRRGYILGTYHKRLDGQTVFVEHAA